jgi:hypothetical protein
MCRDGLTLLKTQICNKALLLCIHILHAVVQFNQHSRRCGKVSEASKREVPAPEMGESCQSHTNAIPIHLPSFFFFKSYESFYTTVTDTVQIR